MHDKTKRMFRRRFMYECCACAELFSDMAQARDHYVENHGVELELSQCIRCGEPFRVMLPGQKVCPKRDCLLKTGPHEYVGG